MNKNEIIQKEISEFKEYVKEKNLKASLNLAFSKDGKIFATTTGKTPDIVNLLLQFLYQNKKVSNLFYKIIVDELAKNKNYGNKKM